MTFESILRKVTVASVTIVFVLCAEASSMPHGSTRVIASSPMPVSGSPDVATVERVVLHGVRFQNQSDRIDKRSVPVLDYAVQTIKQNPKSLIYVKVRCIHGMSKNCTGRELLLVNRRTQAVASYFQQRGVSASRLILLGSGTSPYDSEGSGDTAKSVKQNFEVVQVDLVSSSD